MHSTTFDRLSRLFAWSGTRRAALSALLGAALPVATFRTAAAKRELQGNSKPNGKGRRHGKQKRKGHNRARTQAKSKPGNHCISPSSGDDLNEIYGISVQIVTSFCQEVGSGEQWTVGGAWLMAQRFEAVPEGFTPAGDTPLADFIAKFSEVTYVIDPGTQHEQTVVFDNGDKLSVDTDFDGGVLVSPITLGTLHPLSVGPHVVDVYWKFSALHCDGLGNVIEDNCLPAGAFQFGPPREFQVTPGHH